MTVKNNNRTMSRTHHYAKWKRSQFHKDDAEMQKQGRENIRALKHERYEEIIGIKSPDQDFRDALDVAVLKGLFTSWIPKLKNVQKRKILSNTTDIKKLTQSLKSIKISHKHLRNAWLVYGGVWGNAPAHIEDALLVNIELVAFYRSALDDAKKVYSITSMRGVPKQEASRIFTQDLAEVFSRVTGKKAHILRDDAKAGQTKEGIFSGKFSELIEAIHADIPHKFLIKEKSTRLETIRKYLQNRA
ncbi:MAG: hypothetical protein JO126_04925 [Alphaproteobacteria bacterium]|nr:hypothetical protein [Alphaproteobacteria bacterium]